MPDHAHRTLALRWLASARRATFVAQLAVMGFAERTEIHLHSPALVGVLALWVAADVAQALGWGRRPPPASTVPAWAAIDLVAFTAILVLSGGQHSPLLFGYLAYLALLAMVLPAAHAWVATGCAMVLQAFVVLHPVEVPGLAPDHDGPAHLLGHIATFDLSAGAITWVVTRLSLALRERAERDRAAEREREATERLAALGTLAAGVAHELGTPLGAIQLLAEKARRRTPDPEAVAALDLLVDQVGRCGSILDRLRGREAAPASSVVDVARWVQEWRPGAPELDVAVVAGGGAAKAAGAEEGWRGAVWVALDNARRAGASRVVVRVAESPRFVEVVVEDDGCGLDEEAARRVGEPFWTGWGGTGLGLFAARTFARSVGGDLRVEPRAPGGARTVLALPRVTA